MKLVSILTVLEGTVLNHLLSQRALKKVLKAFSGGKKFKWTFNRKEMNPKIILNVLR